MGFHICNTSNYRFETESHDYTSDATFMTYRLVLCFLRFESVAIVTSTSTYLPIVEGGMNNDLQLEWTQISFAKGPYKPGLIKIKASLPSSVLLKLIKDFFILFN